MSIAEDLFSPTAVSSCCVAGRCGVEGSFHARVSLFFNGCIGLVVFFGTGGSGCVDRGVFGTGRGRLLEGRILFLALTAAVRRGREGLNGLAPACMLREEE